MWSGQTVCSQPPSFATPCTVITLEPMPSIAAPILLSIRATSCTCGSQAALRMIVVPAVAAAAISAFSVPITDGSSMKKSHGRRPPSGAVITMSLAVLDGRAEGAERVEVRVQPAAADHVAARRRHRRARRSAPAAGRRPGTRRGSARRGPRRRRSCARWPRSARRCWARAARRVTPRSASRSSSASVSRIRGTLCSVTSLVREQRAGQQRQRGVLVPGGHDGAGQRHAAFDDELLHRGGG